MATIQSQIQLVDSFTAPMMNIINAVNMGVGAMEDMQDTMNESFDPSGIQAMRDDLNQAAASVTDLQNRFEEVREPIVRNTDKMRMFDREIQNSAVSADNLTKIISGAVGDYAGMAGVRKVFEFIQDTTSAFDTQLNAERQLIGVIANTLDRDYAAQFELETSADITGAVDDIAAVHNNVDEVVIPVSAETSALTAAFDTITKKASEIQSRGIYGDEAMIAAAAEFATYFSDTSAVEMMMDTLANYAMGMSGGGALGSSAMVNYATNLGKLMTGAYDAMTKKGFEFSNVQKAIIEGEATREQIIATLGEEYADMSADMQAAATITQIIDEAWAGLYDNISNTPQGKIIQLSNAWGDMQEKIGGKLYPAVEGFFDVINDNWDTIETIMIVFTDGLSAVIVVLSAVADGAFAVADIFIGNWSWIEPIVGGVAAALAVYYGLLVAYKAQTLLATAAQKLFNGSLLQSMHLASGLALVFGVTVAAIGFFTNGVNEAYGTTLSFAGMVIGTLMKALAALGNFFIFLAKVAVGCWEGLQAVGSNIYSFFFNRSADMAAELFTTLSSIMSFVERVCEALNALPFIEFDYSGVTDKANEFARLSAEASGMKHDYMDLGEAWIKGWNSIDFIDLNEAFDAGYYLGEELEKKLGGSNEDVYSSYDKIQEMLDNIKDIEDDTNNISDSMELSEEDLKYLRDIAEQETVNRFTTAEIHIEQTHHNNISSKMDLDGFISGLADAMDEAVEVMTEGVHI